VRSGSCAAILRADAEHGVQPLPFPRPRSLEWLGGGAPSNTALCEERVADLKPQGYELRIADGRIELAYADEAGRRYGAQTLAQLRGRAEADIPHCQIVDWPDFEIRGHMLDISRDRVPTRETLEWLVTRLAALRYNHLQLYTEHTFAYRDHEKVWRHASPMTPGDVQWLDQLCAAHGIELAANQNTFGHMERWLAHEPYRSWAEIPEGWHEGAGRRRPTALAPTPENAEFSVSLVRELAANFHSRCINIGCDEVRELGRGVSAAAVKERGKLAVFVEHLRRIAEPLLTDGYEVMFWADMVQNAPAGARPLADAGAIAAVWGYEAPAHVDLERIDFAALPENVRDLARDYLETSGRGFGPRLEAFADAGFRTWVVPGTSGWNTFVGRRANARGNLLDAVESGTSHAAEGILVTEWGDNGHMQPPFSTLPALAFGGATAWCRATNGDLDDAALATAVSDLVKDPTGRVGWSLLELAGVADHLGLLQTNGTPLFYSAVKTAFDWQSDAPKADALDAALTALEAAVDALDAAAPETGDGRQLIRETRQAAALARHGLRRLALDHGLESADRGGLADELDRLVEEQRACWLARSRPGGLEDSLARLRRPDAGAA